MLDEIESKVENESQDTTSETEGEINKDTNKIKEINDITIDSDEKLVTLNITDQEGHIIYSYILKFTREGTGVTNASASASATIRVMALPCRASHQGTANAGVKA